MLSRHLTISEVDLGNMLQVVGEGYPTVLALAMLCAGAIAGPKQPVEASQLSDEALALLATAKDRGVFEIKASRDSFDSVERFLGVCVEVEPESYVMFRRKRDPQQSVRFLEAFADLCRHGLVIHHLQRDFSLSPSGFDLARQVETERLQGVIDFAVDASS